MKQRFLNTEEVLVLTNHPQNQEAALEWRPFWPGNTLGEIITAHNLRCNGMLKEKTPGPFVECLPEITPALTINTFSAGAPADLSKTQSRVLKILLLDLDQSHYTPQALEPIINRLDHQNQITHLVQVSRASRPESRADYFANETCILRSEPEIFQRQTEFEAFLHAYRFSYENAWCGVIKNPLDAPCVEEVHKEPYIHPRRGHFLKPNSQEGRSVERVYREYRRRLPKLLADIRDVAMARRLMEDQVVNLGRTAAIQELLLTLIAERVRPRPGYRVSVRSIRMPLLDMQADRPLEMRELEQKRLIALHLIGSVGGLDQDKANALAELGIRGGIRYAVQFDRPDVWGKIAPVRNNLRIEQLTSELPGWRVKPRDCRVSLSEISIGLQIEESKTSHSSWEVANRYTRIENSRSVSIDNE